MSDDVKCELFAEPKRFCLTCNEAHPPAEEVASCRYHAGRTYHCKTCGGWHPEGVQPDNCREWLPDNRSELASPMIVTDEMGPTKGMHNGEVYTSKRALRQSYKDHGVVEVGNDSSITAPKPKTETKKQKLERNKKTRESIRKAVSRVNLTTPSREIPRNYRL